MSHIPYYGEEPAKISKKEANSMILNQKQLANHNLKMFNTFVDLKVTGWKTYSKALNDYTFNFYKDSIDQMDVSVETIGKNMKEVAKTVSFA